MRYSSLRINEKPKLEKIDEKIRELAYEREFAIGNLEVVGNEAFGEQLYSTDALTLVMASWKILAGKSKLVCAPVQHLRKPFFDDEADPKTFKNIVCYGIEEYDYFQTAWSEAPYLCALDQRDMIQARHSRSISLALVR